MSIEYFQFKQIKSENIRWNPMGSLMEVPVGTDRILFRRNPPRIPTDGNPTQNMSDPIGIWMEVVGIPCNPTSYPVIADRIHRSDWISWVGIFPPDIE
jgi:hypothetical protein